MLAARSLRLVAGRYVQASRCVWYSNARTLPLLEPNKVKFMVPTFSAAYSKDAKTAEPPLKSNNTDNISPPLSPTTSSSPSKSKIIEENTQVKECSTGTFGEAGLKLPNKDQVEAFVFKSLVYISDFVYYIFCLSRKLFEKYVINNPTVQQSYKRLQQRLDEARKELKHK